MNELRINKYLAECGLCSRREGDLLVQQRRVFVNGQPAEPGTRVRPGDEVTADGKCVTPVPEKTYLAFHKPAGVVCTFDRREPGNLAEYLHYPGRITYAGRLDKQTEGLLLLTDDGDLIHLLMSASGGHEKEYVVTARENIREEQLKTLRAGIRLEEIHRDTRPCKAWKTADRECHIVLTEGINRQIRRMCSAVGIRILRLQRIRIENILLGDLPKGAYRPLSCPELLELKRLVAPGKRERKQATSV